MLFLTEIKIHNNYFECQYETTLKMRIFEWNQNHSNFNILGRLSLTIISCPLMLLVNIFFIVFNHSYDYHLNKSFIEVGYTLLSFVPFPFNTFSRCQHFQSTIPYVVTYEFQMAFSDDKST